MQFSQFLMSPIAAALAGAVLLVGGIAGVSAATGGPDVTEPVRDAVGAGDNGHGDDSDGGVSEDDRDNVDDNSGAESPSTPFATPDSSDDNSGHGNSDDGDDDQSGPGGGGDDDGSPESPGATPDDDDEEGRSPSSPEATPDDDSEDPPETPEPTQTAEPGDDDGGHSGSGGADGNSGPGS